jgi:hypothetical protein
MPMWRCPHCGTPQAETARCWVCQRSSTACGTCRHFRRSVAAQIGYCGLDRLRQPLSGAEIRGCWEAWPAGEATRDLPLTIVPARRPDEDHHREFVEVGVAAVTVSMADAVADEAIATDGDGAADPPPRPDAGWSFWGDPDRSI